MLASYMTAVQISRLLKPHARFVNQFLTFARGRFARIIGCLVFLHGALGGSKIVKLLQ